MPKVVTPECVYNIWLTDFLKYVLADGAEAEQLKSSLVTLIKNMDCDKKTAIWDAEWDCIKNDLEKLSNIFQQILDAYGKDKLAQLFNDMWTDLTNDQLNQIGKLLKGRVVPAVCNTGGLENVVTCASEDQDIKLYCLRIKISTDADNIVTIGSDGGLYVARGLSCTEAPLSVVTKSDGSKCVSLVLDPDTDNIASISDAGLLVLPPASKVSTVYVDSNKGSDTVVDDKGNIVARSYSSRDDAFKTIDAAIFSTANGSVVQCWIECNSNCYLSTDGNPVDHASSTEDLGTFYVGNRSITFISYGDALQEQKEIQYNTEFSDGTPSWGLASVKRPTINFVWRVLDNGSDRKIISCRGINGDTGAVVKYLGVKIAIQDIELLNSETYSDYDVVCGWFWNGLSYMYSYVEFGKLPKGTNKYFGGGGGLGTSNHSFNYRNNFADGISNLAPNFFAGVKDLTVIDNMNGDGSTNTVGSTNDLIMSCNGSGWIQRDSIYYGGVSIVYNPSKSYKNLTTNFAIDFVQYPDRLTT